MVARKVFLGRWGGASVRATARRMRKSLRLSRQVLNSLDEPRNEVNGISLVSAFKRFVYHKDCSTLSADGRCLRRSDDLVTPASI